MDYARTLEELDPATVADRALADILAHVGRLTIGWGIDLFCVAELRGKTDVHDKMRQLTEYAQRGLPMGDWTRPTDVEETLLYILDTLYGSPCARGEVNLRTGGMDIDVIDDTKPHSEYDYVHLALLAAVTRFRLAELEDVTAKGLGALAGEDWSDGDEPDELEDDNETVGGYWPEVDPFRVTFVPHEEALAWLVEREVPGIQPAS